MKALSTVNSQEGVGKKCKGFTKLDYFKEACLFHIKQQFVFTAILSKAIIKKFAVKEELLSHFTTIQNTASSVCLIPNALTIYIITKII